MIAKAFLHFVSGIFFLGEALVSYWPFFPVPSNSPRTVGTVASYLGCVYVSYFSLYIWHC